MATVAFKIQGMDCAEEVTTLRNELGTMAGVQDLSFEIFNAKMTVTYHGGVSSESLQVAVKRTGMTAIPWSDQNEVVNPKVVGTQQLRTMLTTASGILVGAGFSTHAIMVGLRGAVAEGADPIPLVVKMLYGGAAVSGVWFVLPKSWAALRRFRPDMNLLMVVAVIGAISISFCMRNEDWASQNFLYCGEPFILADRNLY
jgi:Cd2+/Zn2+-exporting ATPase